MRLAVVVHTIGTLVLLFGPAFLAPAVVAGLYGEWVDVGGFLLTGLLTVGLGLAMRKAGTAATALRRVEGLAIVAGTWLLLAHLGAVPFVWAGLPPIDALFEAMSGLTTTGATTFVDFAAFDHGIFFWRSMSQWLGGLGVIALFVAVLPRLAIGGRELFFAEAAGPTDETLTPQLRQTARTLWLVYVGLTLLEIVALRAAGMSIFDAVCHGLTTLAAGGFSPHPASIAGYNSATVEWIVTVFMLAAGASFAMQYRALRGGGRALIRDEETRAYLGLVVVAAAVVAFFLVRADLPAVDAVRHGAFQVVSILTTTGFASTDFQTWDAQGKIMLFLLMFVGGCAGSAAGGPKIVRHVLMARFTLRELKRTLHPRGVLPVKLNGRVVPERILHQVEVFMLFYLLVFSIGTAIVVALGEDLITGITASIACLGNIGPGIDSVGPMANYAHLHPVSKVVLTLEMWIGRLEVLTVLVFFRLEPWSAAHWRAR